MTDAPESWPVRVVLALVAGALATIGAHVVVATRYLPGDLTRAVPLLVLGWAAFAVAWYALGRLFAAPTALPSTRTTDVGLGVFLLSVLVGGGLDALGMTPELAPAVHALPALGVYVGLALLGWGLGSRTKSINRGRPE